METPAPTTDPAPAPKPGRKPLDPAAREAAAVKAKTRQMAKKLAKASTADEFWDLADELAVKSGRKPLKVAETDDTKKSEIDPADVPIAPSWPTPRQIAEVQPFVTGAVGGLASLLAETRYNALSVPLKVPGPAGPNGEKTSIEIDRAMFITEPAAACVALITGGKAPDIHPGAALALAVAFAFGPAAIAHGWELWTASKQPDAPKAPSKTEGPKLAKEGA